VTAGQQSAPASLFRLARAVHDRLGSLHGGGQPFTSDQVTGDEERAAAGPAQYPDVAARLPQPLHYLLAERAGPAGDRPGPARSRAEMS
jgi:hypothetical protein